MTIRQFAFFVAAFVFSGCAMPYYMAELQLSPERIVVDGKKDAAFGESMDYADSLLAVSVGIAPKHHAFDAPALNMADPSHVRPSTVGLSVQNRTSEVCEIVWDQSGVIDIEGYMVEVVRGETREISELGQQRAHAVLPGSKTVISMYPINEDQDLLGLEDFEPRSPSHTPAKRKALASLWARTMPNFAGRPISVTATFRFPTQGTRTISFFYRVSEMLFYEVKSKKRRLVSKREIATGMP